MFKVVSPFYLKLNFLQQSLECNKIFSITEHCSVSSFPQIHVSNVSLFWHAFLAGEYFLSSHWYCSSDLCNAPHACFSVPSQTQGTFWTIQISHFDQSVSCFSSLVSLMGGYNHKIINTIPNQRAYCCLYLAKKL